MLAFNNGCLTTGAPDPPRDSSILAAGGNWALISWKAPTNTGSKRTITRYQVEVCTTHSTEDDVTQFNVTGLEPERSYEFRIAAVSVAGTGNISGMSGYSESISTSTATSSLTGLPNDTATISVNSATTCNCQQSITCLLYTSPSPRDATLSRMPSSA